MAIYARSAGEWFSVEGGGSGDLGGAVISNTPTGNYVDSGVTYDYWEFAANASLNVTGAGIADMLIVGAGASGGSGYGAGGGAGALVEIRQAFLSESTHTIVVGAGGAASAITVSGNSMYGRNGNASVVGDYLSPGGGAGAAGMLSFSPVIGL